VTIGRFQETEFLWPVSGDESDERSVASVPDPAGQLSPKQPFSQTQFLRNGILRSGHF
jgi:hypothetical protein